LLLVRDAWVMLGIALLLIAGIEVSWRLFLRLPIAAAKPPEILERMPWGAQYLADAKPYRFQYVFAPYIQFKAGEYRSQTINVSEEGVRLTPFNDPSPGFTAFVFGGSTMLGVGVPDWGTIPAYLSKQLKDAQIRHEIVNYGSGWWTSSQSVIQLVSCLEQGQRPDVVVFYDGINEANVVSYGGTAGSVSPEIEQVLRQAMTGGPPDVLVAHSVFLSYLREKTRGIGFQKGYSTFPLQKSEIPLAADAIVRHYEQNVRFVTALGDTFGFVPYFFLQPAPIIAKKPLTEGEKAVISLRRDRRGEGEGELFERVYAGIRGSEYLGRHPRFHDLENLFADDARPLYIDSEHLLPEGNERVASAMAALIGTHWGHAHD
jgi:lysophospholipase L1-like esterase